MLGVGVAYDDVEVSERSGDVCVTYPGEDGETLLLFPPDTDVEQDPLRVVLRGDREVRDGETFYGSLLIELDDGHECGGEHFENAGLVM